MVAQVTAGLGSSVGTTAAGAAGGIGLGSVMGGVGAAVQLVGTMLAANAAAEAAERQAILNTKKAEEVLARNTINNELLMKAAGRHQGVQTVQIAGSGRAQDTTTMAMMEETWSIAVDQVERNTRSAQWEATQILEGVNSMLESADDTRTTGIVKGIGDFGFNAAKLYDSAPSGEFTGISASFSEAGSGIGDFFGGLGSNIGEFLGQEYQKEQLKGSVLPAEARTASSPFSARA